MSAEKCIICGWPIRSFTNCWKKVNESKVMAQIRAVIFYFSKQADT